MSQASSSSASPSFKENPLVPKIITLKGLYYPKVMPTKTPTEKAGIMKDMLDLHMRTEPTTVALMARYVFINL